jgi:hypothetical protein
MPAVLSLAPELIAAVALLVVLCVYFGVQLLLAIARWAGVQNWPLIGGSLMNAISSVAGWVGGALSWLWSHANPINMFLATVGWLAHQLAGMTGTIVWDIYSTIHRVTTSSIPGAIAAAEALSRTLYTDATAIISADVTWLEGRIVAYYNAAVAVVNADIAAARAYSVALYDDAITFVDQRVAAAEAAAVGLVQSLQGWVVQELGALRTWATGEIAATAQTLEGDISAGLRGLEQTLTPEIAAAAAVGAAAAATFKAWEDSCGTPLCNNLLNFGSIISALENIISDGALVALIALAVSDPQGAVNIIVDDVVQPVDDAVSTVLSVVGINLQPAA